jgi:hypothetical protein
MPEIEPTLTQLEQFFRFIQTAQAQLGELRRENYLDDEMFEQQRSQLAQQIRGYRKQMATVLDLLCRYPPQHDRHFKKLPEFHKDGGYESSVFIMTKFPDGATAASRELSTIIDAVKAAVTAQGHVPRIALGQNYHRWLFDNVELFLLGCARGIAIVEDKYLPELNPNVALEWGWMVGMGREVLFLREQSFVHARADWTGLINATFDWANPAPGVDAAVAIFLPKGP